MLRKARKKLGKGETTKTVLIVAAAVALCGCATRMTTKPFFEQETAITNECLGSALAMPIDQAMQLDLSTGRSPIRAGAECYAHKTAVAAWASEYQNAQIVEARGRLPDSSCFRLKCLQRGVCVRAMVGPWR